MALLYIARDSCRLCGRQDFDLVIDLGELALTGHFPAPEDPAVPAAPLRVQKCRHCHLVQLAHDFDRDALFRQTYGYRSGVNRTMTEHLKGIAQAAMARSDLRPDDLVLDIGSNDATLLKHYPEGSCLRLGMDPTIAQYGSYYPEDCLKVPDFFSASAYAEAVGGRRAKIITSIAMLYDVPDLHAFVADIAACLAPEGVWVFEQSYLPLMLETTAFDTICHEHLLYFSLDPLRRLLAEHGLRIFHAELNDCNGGSCRLFACHGSAEHDESLDFRSLVAEESRLGLDTLAPFDAFREQVRQLKSDISSFLNTEREAGASIYGYGASTKGNTTLQYCGIGPETITAIADRNPKKSGLTTPGTRIPIIGEAEARAAGPDVFFVLPWHFKSEFVEREGEYLAGGGRLVFPLPGFEVVEQADLQASAEPAKPKPSMSGIAE